MSPNIKSLQFSLNWFRRMRRMCIILWMLTFHQNWVCFFSLCVDDVQSQFIFFFVLFVCWNLHYYTFFCKVIFSVTYFYAIHLTSKKKKIINEQRAGNNHLYYWSWSLVYVRMKKKKQQALMEFFRRAMMMMMRA